MSEPKISYAIYDKVNHSTKSNVDPSKIQKSDKIAFWGPTNNLPKELTTEGGKSGVFVGNMGILRKAHYGNGITLYRNVKHEESGKISKQTEHLDFLSDEIRAFWKNSKLDRFFLEKIYDLEMFNICFPEYILSKDYSKITRVKRQHASSCRFELMNEKNRLVENVYIKSSWDNNSVDEFTDKVPLIDFYWSADEVREYCKKKKIRKFIRPEFFPTIMNGYYPDIEYSATFKNGWLKYANQIPELKNTIIDQGINIRFIIHISEKYFEKTHGKTSWDKKTDVEKMAIRKSTHDAIDDHLSGKNSVGRSIKSPTFLDDTGNWVDSIKVTEIGNSKTQKEGEYLTDGTAANQETSFAMGVDPSITGAGIPGGKLGAGSGSDKRIAYLILSSLMKTNRLTSIDSFYFIKDYNSWDDKLHADFSNTILTTLDKNPTGSENKM